VTGAELFDRPAAWRFHAAERLALSGEDRVAALAMGAGYPAALEPIRDVVADCDGLVCDVGTGLGAAVSWIGRTSAARLVGVEPEPRAAALAHRAFPQLAVVSGSASALSLRTASCAAVTLLGVVSLLEDVGEVLAETVRVLSPGGWLGFTDLVSLTSATVTPATGNTIRPADELADAMAAHGIEVLARTQVSHVADDRWSEVSAAIDDEVARRHAGTPTYDTWTDDRRVLRGLLDDATIGVVTIIARSRS
jgi:SAM-dependent methyltransferase